VIGSPKQNRAGLDRSSVFRKICVLLPPFEHNLTNPLHGNTEHPRQVTNGLALCVPRPDFVVAPMFGRGMVCEWKCRCRLPNVEQHHTVSNSIHKMLECPASRAPMGHLGQAIPLFERKGILPKMSVIVS
jgi:hypothetical protein